MKALLLAAGFGTRLRPITDTIPKCLVPIDGKPLMEYWLDELSTVGIKEFIINTHYLHEQVEQYIKNSKYKDRIILMHEDELLLTGGTILNAKKYLLDDSFMVVHADNLSFCDFDAFINNHKNRPNECEITMMTFQTDTPESCGIVELNEKNVVIGFHEKVNEPPSNLANGAVYIFEPCVLNFLESLQKNKIDISTEVIPSYIGRIFTYENNLYHRDIGSVESYNIACRDMKNKNLRSVK